MQTRIFRSGNSLAVRIPKDLAIFEPSQDVVVERIGDTLVLRAAERKSLANVVDIFAQFGADFMADGRGDPGWLDFPVRGGGGEQPLWQVQEPEPTKKYRMASGRHTAAGDRSTRTPKRGKKA